MGQTCKICINDKVYSYLYVKPSSKLYRAPAEQKSYIRVSSVGCMEQPQRAAPPKRRFRA